MSDHRDVPSFLCECGQDWSACRCDWLDEEPDVEALLECERCGRQVHEAHVVERDYGELLWVSCAREDRDDRP